MALTFLCAGDYGNAAKFAGRQPDIRHPLLQVVRWMTSLVNPHVGREPLFADAVHDDSMNLDSLDPRAPRSFAAWSDHCVEILKVSNQTQLLGAVEKSGALKQGAA